MRTNGRSSFWPLLAVVWRDLTSRQLAEILQVGTAPSRFDVEISNRRARSAAHQVKCSPGLSRLNPEAAVSPPAS